MPEMHLHYASSVCGCNVLGQKCGFAQCVGAYMLIEGLLGEKGRVAVEGKASRSLRNSAMHLRKACNHPFLFLAGQHPPYEPADAEEIVRASGKIHALDNILPKLRATGARPLRRLFFPSMIGRLTRLFCVPIACQAGLAGALGPPAQTKDQQSASIPVELQALLR